MARAGHRSEEQLRLRKTQTNKPLAAAGFVFTVSPEFPAEKQLEPYSVLWFNVVFIELSIMKAGLKLFSSHLKS